jgi:glycine cleavage system H lipoate-binding protein
MVVILVLLMVTAFFTVDYFIQRAEARKRALATAPVGHVPIRMPVTSVPHGVLFDKSHQWVEILKNGSLKIGIDYFPGAILGTSLAVDLPAAGTEVRKGSPLFTVKKGGRTLSMPALSDGLIEEVNPALVTNPERLKDDPFGAGWVYRMKPSAAELPIAIRIGDAAVEWLKSEYRTLREYVGSVSRAPAFATLQDGGEPVEGFADQLNEEQWKELRTKLFG